jgi:hypothetical protein
LHSAKFEIIGDGQGVERPKLDEYISVDGMLHAVPSGRPKRSFIWEALRNRATRRQRRTALGSGIGITLAKL